METTFKKPERVKVDALAHLSVILKNGLDKDLQEHQILCPTCSGTGLAITNQVYGLKNDPDRSSKLFPYSNQYIVSCQNCYTGIINLCEHCAKELPRSKSRCDCEKAKAQESAANAAKEQAAWDKAIKLKADDDIAKSMGMYYHNSYPYGEGYFNELEDFIEWWNDNHGSEDDEFRPIYVWGTESMGLILDAESILESACDDLHEDASNRIEGQDELQEFLEAWCAKQQGTTTYYSSSKYAIEIPW